MELRKVRINGIAILRGMRKRKIFKITLQSYRWKFLGTLGVYNVTGPTEKLGA